MNNSTYTNNLNEIFHEPFPNNFVYLHVPKRESLEAYIKNIAQTTKGLNEVDLAVFSICKLLLKERKLKSLYQWAKCIESKINLQGIPHALRTIDYIKSELSYSDFSRCIADNHAGVLDKVYQVSDDLIKITRINLYISFEDIQDLSNMLLPHWKKSGVDPMSIERLEISKKPIVSTSYDFSYPTFIIYLNDRFVYKQSYIVMRLIAKLVNFCQSLHGNRKVSAEYSHCLYPNIFLTQGYRLYKKYLAALGKLGNFYVEETNYALAGKTIHDIKGCFWLEPLTEVEHEVI